MAASGWFMDVYSVDQDDDDADGPEMPNANRQAKMNKQVMSPFAWRLSSSRWDNNKWVNK